MSETVRLDKWLWYARFFKTRSLAGKFVSSGKIRINGQPVAKSHQTVGPGDVLTFPLGPHVRVIRIEAPGERRGPAPEARTLYTDLDPPRPRTPDDPARPAPAGKRDPGSGRPTKTERRATDRLKGHD